MRIDTLPHQMRFLQSQSKFVWLKCGLGAGKTWALAQYIIKRMLTNPETMGLIAANSYDQLNKSILAELFSQLTLMGLSYTHNSLTKTLTLHATGAVASTISLEKYDTLRGIEFGWLALEEMAFSRIEAYQVAIGRLRCKHSHALQVRIASTPNGFNFMYDRFGAGGYISRDVTPVFKRDEYHEMISASAYENFYLPPDYLPSLLSQYDPLLYEQEVLGEFINTALGKVYHAFDRSLHLSPMSSIPITIEAGCDFNVNPITAAMGSVVGNQSVHIFHEIWMEHSNTFELAEKLVEVNHNMVIYPDATGAARKTSATKTDHQILRDANLTVKTRRSNPAVKDRYNNTNRWLANGWLKIDPKCEKLIADFDKMTHDNRDPEISHISDALGYMLWYINPLKRPTRKSRIH